MVIFNKIIQNIVCAVTLLFVTTNAYCAFKTLRTGSGISAILYSTKNPANEKNLHVQVPGDTNIYYGGLTTTPIEDTIRMSIDGTVYYLKLDEITPTFFISLTDITAGETFEIQLSPQGRFVIDCGNGDVQTINRTNTTNTTYSCTYTSGGNYTVGIGGLATSYSINATTAAISFYSSAHASPHPNRAKMTGISGDLGRIFPMLNTTTSGSPRFYETFRLTAITSIPPELFASVRGAPTSDMFRGTFSGCSSLTGSIPEELFSGITGAPASNMFRNTFANCRGLTSIPEGLFSGITGAPANDMFSYTFWGCSGLTGSIPAGLFGNLTGAPANNMFRETFYGCSGLTSIPVGLFGNLTGTPASSMFRYTFYGCSGLRDSIPEGLFGNLTGVPASEMFQGTFSGCSGLTGSIPAGLFGNLTGAPASYMFSSTFQGCSGLTSIPDGLFDGITGAEQSDMFRGTFSGCTGLRGQSAKSDGQYLYEKWPDVSVQATGCYGGGTWQNLDDAASIPSTWR
ncbi:MAG: hypothetical protein FWG80_01610 [Alphaproteobacteria bacterium]|nr:hypothetical protein [Alphaproteobacteria bacterium]